jgi:hypothetical protein
MAQRPVGGGVQRPGGGDGGGGRGNDELPTSGAGDDAGGSRSLGEGDEGVDADGGGEVEDQLAARSGDAEEQGVRDMDQASHVAGCGTGRSSDHDGTDATDAAIRSALRAAQAAGVQLDDLDDDL